MRSFFSAVVRHPKQILAVFLAAAAVCAVLWQQVQVNYDMNDYLPEDSASTVALDVMEQEFDGGIPNARVMVKDVTVAQAQEYKARLEAVEGVTEVQWLDDSVDLSVPLEALPQETVEAYYKDGCALFTVTIRKADRISAVSEIRSIIGDDNAMSGSAVSAALATTSTVREIRIIVVFAVLFVLLALTLTTTSWLIPLVVLAGLGIAILLNSGTNLIFGEISFVTNAAGNILQLAVSLDYSVFLFHRFEECRRTADSPEQAMTDALCQSLSSILSSGLTTVIGFLALVCMRFRIGPDLGLALAKGVAISLLSVFLCFPSLVLLTRQWIEKTRHRSLMPDFHGFGRFVTRIMMPAAVVLLLIAVPAWRASLQNSYSYGSSHIFGLDTQLGQDVAAIEEVFGKRDTYVLLVPKDDLPRQKELSAQLQALEPVSGVISYVDTVGAAIPSELLPSRFSEQLISEHYSRIVLQIDADYEGDETFRLVEQIRSLAQEYYPDEYYLAGEGVSTYDLMDTITADTDKVNAIAVGAVLAVLLFALKSPVLAVVLVLSIETAIWVNMAVPALTGSSVFYISYLIISSIQLGATVDYAILFTERYRENRTLRGFSDPREAAAQTVSDTAVSILTSGSVLTVVGFLLGGFSSHGILAQLGVFLGRGTLLSMAAVFFALPGLLRIFDRNIAPQPGLPAKQRRR